VEPLTTVVACLRSACTWLGGRGSACSCPLSGRNLAEDGTKLIVLYVGESGVCS
jgi:hypothetical protein